MLLCQIHALDEYAIVLKNLQHSASAALVLAGPYDDFVACNGEHGAREAGKLRSEGKDYIVHDGDVMHFRFNV